MTRNSVSYSLFFTGTGSGGNLSVGSSAAVLEADDKPILLIDCGPGTLNAFAERYQGELPAAIFITHCHLDHIADLEILTVRARLRNLAPIPIFVPVGLIQLLHERLASYPGQMAEGNHDFWQSFQLRPVSDSFRSGDETFRIHPTRHHGPGSSFALQLPGRFFYTGDTRPVPELLHHVSIDSETIFHDCGTISNPSHTGLEDLEREYREDIRKRLVLYHYADATAAGQMRDAGYKVASPGERHTI
ncbi:MAG: MBL fold metallo-hydrolase [Thalassolituus sp.]|jgi:ribonuclease BN (tRNA processing enzyme)|nr:MAG: MBL fold metallo-hydrolase [Thalassolituus sp.]